MGGVIVVKFASGTTTPIWGNAQDQTVNILYSSTLKNNRFISLSGSTQREDGKEKQKVLCSSNYVDEQRVEDYGIYFLDVCDTCDASGATRGISNEQWEYCENEYLRMSKYCQHLFWAVKPEEAPSANLNKAAERYDFIVDKYRYSGEPYEDFAGREKPGSGKTTSAYKPTNLSSLFEDKNVIITLISVSGSIILLVALAIVAKKLKEE